MKIKAIIAAGAMTLALNTAADAGFCGNGGGMKDAAASSVWTGLYGGVHLGYGWGEADIKNAFNSTSLDPEGIAYGGQLGYNYQCNQWVLGVEGDISGFDADDKLVDAAFPTVTDSTQVDYLASLRARLGIALNNILLFGTVGVAFTELDFRSRDVDPLDPSDFKLSKSATGIVFGGGAEMMIASNVSARAEILHYSFDETHNFAASNIEHDLDTTVFRVGANVHLN